MKSLLNKIALPKIKNRVSHGGAGAQSRNAKSSRMMNSIMYACIENIKNNVMLADENDDILYANPSSVDTLTELTDDLRKTFPHFNVEGLIGSSIHQFHKDPDYVRGRLRQLKEGQVHSARIAIGDITFLLNVGPVFINGKRTGSFVEWQDITGMLRTEAQNQKVAEEIQRAASSIENATSEIAMGNSNLSERTEAQAANIEETTSAMQEITDKISMNATDAQEAKELSQRASEVAHKGGAIVKEAIQGMNDITASSEKISEIIGVIDEIAFQTNLLALNAAVEAARAGEQGRGFAVVASEVRALASRSAKAAGEIKDLITESVQKVHSGSAHVNETGERLSEIVDSISQVSGMVEKITMSTQEQSAGISEINRAITEMDGFTQQNAALVEQAASASRSLEGQARKLVGVVAESQ